MHVLEAVGAGPGRPGSAAGVRRHLRHRDVDDLGGECRDQVGGGEVEVDAVGAAAEGDPLARHGRRVDDRPARRASLRTA